ncbi:MAG TPA: ATP-binding protein [Gemmatimonadota bacterium]|nr:ATP-binding protein [Gemmatimonadota bacterium]
MNGEALPRLLTGSVTRAAEVMPVVVVTGARQTGKSTLVRRLLPEDRPYYSLDDLDIRAQAERFPEELVERAERLVLDEVQRVPDLLLAVKRAVDEGRRAGRFVLTGSTNLLLMRRVSESLAGRATYLTLWPLARREVLGLGRAGLWPELFDHPFEGWSDVLAADGAAPGDWREESRRGGYPVPAVELESDEDRRLWFDGYVRTYLERDLQDLSSIDNLVDFRRLMTATCLRLGQMLNQTELGRDVALPQPTVRRWLNLLEASHQLVRLPAYAVNRTKRLIKTPKAYWCDAGLALRLSGADRPAGPHLENLVLTDLLAWRDACLAERPEIYYWRTAIGEEVDLVIERGSELIGIEVKATPATRSADGGHLRAFRDEYGDAVRGCLLLHAGDRVERLAPRILSVPWWRVV